MGLLVPADQVAAQAFDWIGYAFGRAGVAALALAAFALARRAVWPRSLKIWGRMAAMSLSGQVGPFLLFGVAAHLTTSADMALMMGSAPIFTVILARLFGLAEVWSARAAAGLALGLIGVALSLGSPLADSGATNSGLGRAFALVAAFGYAGGALLSRPVSRAVGAAMAATGSMAISAVLLGALELVAAWPLSVTGLTPPPPAPLAALIALGLVNTGLAYFVYFRLIETAGATFAALNNYIVPCIGVIAGALAFGEAVRPAAWIGLACVLASVALTGSATGAARKIALSPGARPSDKVRAVAAPLKSRWRRRRRRRRQTRRRMRRVACGVAESAAASLAIQSAHRGASPALVQCPKFTRPSCVVGSAAGGSRNRGRSPTAVVRPRRKDGGEKIYRSPLDGERRLLCSSTSDRRTVNDDHLLVKGKTSCATRFFLEPPLSLSR